MGIGMMRQRAICSIHIYNVLVVLEPLDDMDNTINDIRLGRDMRLHNTWEQETTPTMLLSDQSRRYGYISDRNMYTHCTKYKRNLVVSSMTESFLCPVIQRTACIQNLKNSRRANS